MNIIIIQRIFPHYRKAIFDKLNQVYGVRIFHGRNDSGIQQIETDYSTIIPSRQLGNKDTVAVLGGFRKIMRSEPDIIFHEFTIGIPSLLLVRLLAFFTGAKFVLWGHGINLKRGFKPFSSISDFYRYLLMKTSDAVQFYTPDQMEHVKKYISPKKMFVAYNALDTDTQHSTYQQIAAHDRATIKRELGIEWKYNFIFISRLLATKKPEQIIELFELLPEDIRKQTGVHIIGNGPMFEPLQQLIDQKGFTAHIRLYGEITEEAVLGKYLYCSDFMINPGYLGLSVNLSFAYGCPIITFESDAMEQVHSPEVYYLRDGKTGIKVYNLNLKEMADALAKSLHSGTYRQMRKNCLDTIYQEGSIEQMFSGFKHSIEWVTRN